MNFEASSETIKSLLSYPRTYVVPRFQREFSWSKNNYGELLDDLISQLEFDESGEIFTSQYYLGNMIFMGHKEGNTVEIIDGQQRLTSGTVLLAAIRDCLNNISDKVSRAKDLADTIQNDYLIKRIDGKAQRKLETVTSYPYFTEEIQGDRTENITTPEVKTKEEENLKNNFEFFLNELEFSKLHKNLSGKINGKMTDELYVNILQALRDQFLNSQLIVIFVADGDQAHQIFANINSKGISLAQTDLIKNHMFSRISEKDSGVDEISNIWKDIRTNIKENFDEFFISAWKVRYPRDGVTRSNLYSKYLAKIDSNDTELKELVKYLKEITEVYVHVTEPKIDDYKRKEKKLVYQSLKFIEMLNVTQVNIVLMSLFWTKKYRINNIRAKKIKDFVKFLSDFQFAAYALKSGITGNKLSRPYINFCKEIENSSKPGDVYKAMENLRIQLLNLIDYNRFKSGFKKLTFSKTGARLGNDMEKYTQYAIKVIADNMDGREYHDDEYSIEHIVDENQNDSTTISIGNITVLEQALNEELGRKSIKSKEVKYKQDIYAKSKYKMVSNILKNDLKFDRSVIDKRADDLADYFYNSFLKD